MVITTNGGGGIMRFQNYLIEGTKIKEWDYNPDEMVTLIKKNCKPFLRASKRFIFRGIYSDEVKSDGYQERTSRKDRNPRNTQIHVHAAWDQYFFEKFGWKPRSEGVFATGSYETADDYGNGAIFFPIGRFEYIFSKKVVDIYDYHGEISGTLESFFVNDDGDEDSNYWTKGDDLPDAFIERMDSLDFQNTNLDSSKTNEVVFKCDRYFSIHPIYAEWMEKDLKLKLPKDFNTAIQMTVTALKHWGDQPR